MNKISDGDKTKLRKLILDFEQDEVISLALKDKNISWGLANLLEDPDSEVRENAAATIAKIGNKDFQTPDAVKTMIPQLMKLLESSKAEVRIATSEALTSMAWNYLMWEDFTEVIRPVLPRLVDLLNDSDDRVCKEALEAVAVVVEGMETHWEWYEDKKAAQDIYEFASPWLVSWLQKALGDTKLRSGAIRALRVIAHINPLLLKSTLGEITQLLNDSKSFDRSLATAAIRYMAEQYPKDLRVACPSLLTLLEDPLEAIRKNAAIALGFISISVSEAEQVVPALTELLAEKSSMYRGAAVRALANIKRIDPGIIEPTVLKLRSLLEDADEEIRENATIAIKLFLDPECGVKMNNIADGDKQDTTRQARMLVRYIQKEILLRFWQTLQQSASKQNKELDDAQAKVDDVKRQIRAYREEIKSLVDDTNRFSKLKNELRAQMNVVTDPAREVSEHFRRAKTARRKYEIYKGMGWIGDGRPRPGNTAIVTILTGFGALYGSLKLLNDAWFFGLISLIAAIYAFWVSVSLLSIKSELTDADRSLALADLIMDFWEERAEAELQLTRTDIENRYAQKTKEIHKHFFPLLTEANRRVREFNARAGFPETAWEQQCWQNWNPAVSPATAVRFGTITPDTSSQSEKEQSGKGKGGK